MSANSCKPLDGCSGTERVSLVKLSQLTGFPEDFIKKELFLDDDAFPLDVLRKQAARYLDGIYGMEAENQ